MHQTNAMAESSVASHRHEGAWTARWRGRMYWSVRRELWENRSLYLAPLAVAAVFLFGFLISVEPFADTSMRRDCTPLEREQHKLYRATVRSRGSGA